MAWRSPSCVEAFRRISQDAPFLDPAGRNVRIERRIRVAFMFLVSLSLNILVLLPVLGALAANGRAAEHAWGADTAARRILAAIYATILLASVLLLVLHLLDQNVVAWVQALLGAQIVYKLLTVPLVGIRNPVVLSNVGIAVVHAITLIVAAGQPAT